MNHFAHDQLRNELNIECMHYVHMTAYFLQCVVKRNHFWPHNYRYMFIKSLRLVLSLFFMYAIDSILYCICSFVVRIDFANCTHAQGVF